MCCLAILSIAAPAVAQQSPQARVTVTRRRNEVDPHAYIAKVREGMEAAIAGDLAGALAKLQEAAAMDTTRPEAHYYMGEVQRMNGDLPAAIESFRAADQRAVQVGDDRMRARAIQGVADTLERIPERRDEARLAWNEAAAFADAHRGALSPEQARGRMQVIDTVVQMERDYVSVRERIAARAAQGAQTGTPPPPSPTNPPR